MKIIGTNEQITVLKNLISPNDLERLEVEFECVEERPKPLWSELERRDEILFGEKVDRADYPLWFDDVDLKTLYKLSEIDALDYGTEDNMIFVEFMEQHPLMRAHGYADEYEVVIEGLEYHQAVTIEQVVDFTAAFCHADEFEVGENKLYCKFDYINR